MKYLKLFMYRFNVLQLLNKVLVYILILSFADILLDIHLFNSTTLIIIVVVMASDFQYEGFSLEYLKLTNTKLFNLELVSIVQRIIFITAILIILRIVSGIEFFAFSIEVYDSFTFVDVLLFYILLVINASFLVKLIYVYFMKYLFLEKAKYFILLFFIVSIVIGIPLGLYTEIIFRVFSQDSSVFLNDIELVRVSGYIFTLPIIISLLVWYLIIHVLSKLRVGY